MRCPLTRARICALMYPTSVPTYSKEIGTSSSITDATLTTGSGGGAAAPDLSRLPRVRRRAGLLVGSGPRMPSWPEDHFLPPSSHHLRSDHPVASCPA